MQNKLNISACWSIQTCHVNRRTPRASTLLETKLHADTGSVVTRLLTLQLLICIQLRFPLESKAPAPLFISYSTPLLYLYQTVTITAFAAQLYG